MASARVDEEIKRDNISEENLLLQEDKSKNTIIRNHNFKSNDAESKSKRKGEKEKPKGEKEKSEKTEETPAVRSEQDDQEDYRIFGLCRSGQCLSHFACRDPLLYNTNVCDQLTNLLHTRRRYQLCELSLKILTIATILSCTSLVFYQWGLTKCELTERQEATIQMNATNKSMVTTKDNSTITTKAKAIAETFQDNENEDEEKDDEAKASNKDYQGFDTGIHKGKTGKKQEQDQDQEQDFTFDDSDDSNDSDDKENKDTDDEDKNNDKIVISFWPK